MQGRTAGMTLHLGPAEGLALRGETGHQTYLMSAKLAMWRSRPEQTTHHQNEHQIKYLSPPIEGPLCTCHHLHFTILLRPQARKWPAGRPFSLTKQLFTRVSPRSTLNCCLSQGDIPIPPATQPNKTKAFRSRSGKQGSGRPPITKYFSPEFQQLPHRLANVKCASRKPSLPTPNTRLRKTVPSDGHALTSPALLSACLSLRERTRGSCMSAVLSHSTPSRSRSGVAPFSRGNKYQDTRCAGQHNSKERGQAMNQQHAPRTQTGSASATSVRALFSRQSRYSKGEAIQQPGRRAFHNHHNKLAQTPFHTVPKSDGD